MKKRILLSLASLSLLFSGLAGCNKPADSAESKPADTTSEKAPESKTSAPDSKTSNPTSKSSNPDSKSSEPPAPVHTHEYGDATVTVKNGDGKDVFVKECKDKDDKYIGIAFEDYSEKSADFGDNSSYSSVPEELRNESYLLAKSSTITWKINIDKAISGAKIAFGAVCTSSSHSDQTLSNKYQAQVNDGALTNWEFDSETTYGDVGFSTSARQYVSVLTADLVAGENTIILSQGNGGYRLLFGGEVRIHYNSDALPVNAPVPAEGYDITFVPTNCKILVYESGQDYSIDPVETNTTKSRDDLGNICKYVAEDKENGIEEVKPQVNFKVVADDGYVVDGECISISGTQGNEWNKLSGQGNDIYRVTKIKADITITVTAKQPSSDDKDGYAATFNITNGTLIVYAGQKNEAGDNLDTPENGVYYTRDKDGVMTKSDGQFNFEVIPDAGYGFDCGLALGAQASPSSISFITNAQGGAANFSNFKYVSEGLYRITKVAGALIINIVCTPVG